MREPLVLEGELVEQYHDSLLIDGEAIELSLPSERATKLHEWGGGYNSYGRVRLIIEWLEDENA